MSFIERLKNDKILMGIIVGGLIVIGILGFSIVNNQSEVSALEDRRDTLMNELVGINQEITEREVEKKGQKDEVVYETTGLDPAMIDNDVEYAKQFFQMAFSWTNSEQYNEARDFYKRELGDDNSFTKTYLPEDTVIETNDGDLSYIDNVGLRVHMEAINIVPLRAIDDRIHYVAFVTYYPHRNAEDLRDLSALDSSQAIVRFTASGERNDRNISEVEAWVGFGSVLDE